MTLEVFYTNELTGFPQYEMQLVCHFNVSNLQELNTKKEWEGMFQDVITQFACECEYFDNKELLSISTVSADMIAKSCFCNPNSSIWFHLI